MGGEISRSLAHLRSKTSSSHHTVSVGSKESQTSSISPSTAVTDPTTTLTTINSKSSASTDYTSSRDRDKPRSISSTLSKLRRGSAQRKEVVLLLPDKAEKPDNINAAGRSPASTKKSRKETNKQAPPTATSFFHGRKLDPLEPSRAPVVEELKLQKCDGLHFVFKTLLNGDYVSPVQNILQIGGARVLEVGCGKATWAIDMATQYPHVQFVAVDTNPPTSMADVDPALGLFHMPSNLSFDTHDITTLPYDDEAFDFVFCRMQGLALPGGRRVWDGLLMEMTRVCKAGGYVEIVDPNFSPFNEGPRYRRFCDIAKEFFYARNLDHNHGSKLGKLFETDILTNVEFDYVSCPIAWSGPIGDKVAETLGRFMMTVRGYAEPKLGLEPRPDGGEYEAFVQDVFTECREKESFYNLCYAYGMKPTAAA